MKRRILFLPVLAFVVALPVYAEPYWVAWEGNDYPENEGWERVVNGVGPAIRSLSDGILTLDGRADRQIDDYYRMERPLNPSGGEEFVMQWRLRVNEVSGSPLALYDPGVILHSDDDWALLIVFGTDFVRSVFEDVIIPIEAGNFHSIEVRSADMRTYALQVDGSIVYEGSFWEPTFTQSRIQWGDLARGSASHSDWDYFRSGVVPEPWTISLLLVPLCAARRLIVIRRMA